MPPPETDADGPESHWPPLRCRGRWPPPEGPRVAIVGSRRPTPYGLAVAERFAHDLAQAGAIIVSGLALGIDAAAHEGCLAAGGVTLAVLGSGLDVLYPAANAALAERIVDAGGALISQFEDRAPPRRGNFPKRNWIIAQLAELTLVVEAAEGSGALITAEAAIHLGREVMAVPGSVFSALSVGCHQLLRDGAGLAQNPRDVLLQLGRQLEVLDDPLRPPSGLPDHPQPGRDGFLAHLSDVLPVSAADLSRKLALPFSEVLGRLTALELEGRVKRQGPAFIKLTRRSGGA